MFIDNVEIYVKAGNGGNGRVSFRREKFVPAGGPDGGDGGKGGDIVFVVEEGLRTLSDFRHKKKFIAQSGEDGGSSKKSGRNAPDLYIRVPAGTVIKNAEDNSILADLTKAGESRIIAHGGKGGAGNQHFATPVRQAPAFAKGGIPGEELWLDIELRMIADVGLVGFPNAGNSTLLSVISEARPKIADYPFTTLEPGLGVVRVDEGQSFVVADIPGLIEDAHLGAGLGHKFLRHIERTRLLIHVVDISGIEGRNPLEGFELINRELSKYSQRLADKPQIVAANKIDLPEAKENLEGFLEAMNQKGIEVYPISAVSRAGVRELIYKVYNKLVELPETELADDSEQEVVFGVEKEEPPFKTYVKNGVYVAEGPFIKKLMDSVNLYNHESLQYFQRTLKNMGVIESLEELGINEGDTVRMYDFEFEYFK